MKYSLLVACILCVASIHIHAVYYDPYDEQNSEFVLLYNPTNQTINLSEWTLWTPTSPQDATITGSVQPQSFFLVADSGFSQGKDDPSWPDADYEQTITLPNSRGHVAVVNNQKEIVDVVGWGDADEYQTTPHPGVEEGSWLLRINNTNDNSYDFIQADVSFQNSQPATTLEMNIENVAPQITSISVDDESVDSQEIHVTPIPDQEVFVNATIVVQDLNGAEEIRLFINEVEIQNATRNQTQAIFHAQVPISTQTQQLVFLAQDTNASDYVEMPVVLSAVSSLHVPPHIDLSAVPGTTTNITIPITNTGTQDVDIHVRSIIPSFMGQQAAEITYTLAGNTQPLQETFDEHHVKLSPQETIDMILHVKAGYVPAKQYIGELHIVGVAS